LAALLAVGLLALAGVCPAAEMESAGPSSGAEFIGQVLNFVILFGGLTYLLRKPIVKMLEERAALVRTTLEEAEKSSRDAETRLKSIEERAAGLRAELEAIKAKGRAEGETEKDRIMEAARREAERLKSLSQQEIEARVRAGFRELREYAADKALALALERLRSELTPEVHARLVDEALDRLAELNEKNNAGSTLRPGTH
jgi:F-type H+-transporting ATPase subunit b